MIKYWLYISCFLMVLGCKSSTIDDKQSESKLVSVELITGDNTSISVMVPASSSLKLNEHQNQQSILYGKLGLSSTLKLEGESIIMTTISMQAALPPESGMLLEAESQIGKWAIVKGHWAGDLYQAKILCIFENQPSQSSFKDFEAGKANILDLCQ